MSAKPPGHWHGDEHPMEPARSGTAAHLHIPTYLSTRKFQSLSALTERVSGTPLRAQSLTARLNRCRIAAATARSAGPGTRTVLCSRAFMGLTIFECHSCNSAHEAMGMLLAEKLGVQLPMLYLAREPPNTRSPKPPGQINKLEIQDK